MSLYLKESRPLVRGQVERPSPQTVARERGVRALPAAAIPFGDEEDGSTPVRWEPSLGAFPSEWTVDVHEPVSRKLSASLNPFSLHGRGVIPGASRLGRSETVNFSIDQLWPVEAHIRPRRNRPDIYQWRFQDGRRWARRLVSQGVMNQQRLANEFKDHPRLDAQGNFNQLHRIPKLTYYRSTMKAAGELKFAAWNATDAEVWTAYEGLRFMLETFFDLEGNEVTLPDGSRWRPVIVYDGQHSDLDNGFPLNTFSLNGAWPVIVTRLMRLAHVSMAPNADGAWEVFRLDPDLAPKKVGGWLGGGFPLARDRVRDRPNRSRAVFNTRWNFRVDATDNIPAWPAPLPTATTTDDPAEPLPIQARNVCFTPFDVTDPATGELLRRGTVQTFDRLIPAWNAAGTAAMPQAFVTLFGGLSQSVIKKLVFSPTLATLLSVDTQAANERHPQGAAIAKCCYEFWRKLWQIPEELSDFLDPRTIKATTSEVADTRTGKSSPSRVYFDHTLVMSYHGSFDINLNPNKGAGFVTVRPWPIGDTDKLLSAAAPSDFAEVKVYDKQLGLFLIKPVADVSGGYSDIKFTTFTEHPPSHVVGSANLPHFFENCAQDDEWRAAWTFSAGLLSASKRNFYVVDSEFKSGGKREGRGPVLERRMFGATASMPWNDESSTATVGADGQLELIGFNESGGTENIPQNKDALDSIAAGQYDSDQFEWNDWLLGNFGAPGFDPAVDRPRSNYRVALVYSRGLFRAEYEFIEPRSSPIYESLTKDAADLLFRLDAERDE